MRASARAQGPGFRELARASWSIAAANASRPLSFHSCARRLSKCATSSYEAESRYYEMTTRNSLRQVIVTMRASRRIAKFYDATKFEYFLTFVALQAVLETVIFAYIVLENLIHILEEF
jgi:hypothetical protein